MATIFVDEVESRLLNTEPELLLDRRYSLIMCLTYDESESDIVADDTLDGRKTATGFSEVHTGDLSREAV